LFPGFVKNPYQVISKAKLFVSSSNAEGFPNAIVEAMALKIPVVSTNCNSGPAELLDHISSSSSNSIIIGEAGILVPTNDAEKLESGITLLLTNNELATKLAHQGYLRACEYNQDRFINNFLSLIKETTE